MLEIQKKNVWQWLIAALLILVIPNLICWVVQPFVFIRRGYFVWEYLLLACLYPYINRKIFILFWVLFAIYDIGYAASSLYFMDVFEIFHALVKIPAMSVGDMLKWSGVLVLFVALTIMLVIAMERYNRYYPFLRFKFLWPFMFGLLLADFLNGQGPLSKWSIGLLHIKQNIVSAPSWPLMKSVQYALANNNDNNSKNDSKVEYLGSVAQRVFAPKPDSAADKKQILILVESLGVVKDSVLQHEILSPLYQLATDSLYLLREGYTQHRYLTQAGEFREITGYLFHSYQAQTRLVQEKSIFVKKQHEGYYVVGLHGFQSGFYNRKKLWPALGIQEAMFMEDFVKLSMPLCGNINFQGICDTALSTWLINRLKSDPARKEFYYWVTLSTHLPLFEIHDDGYNGFAEKWKKKGYTEHVLQMAYQHQQYFRDLAGKLRQPGAPKAHILLVGDHTPPFLDPDDRALYDELHVPYIDLAPNR
ncbi:hypothetical protein A3860_16680 [Niastella vici]|uniref:Sulfatase N-terminal domain-containing protein n=1 Tax=Niastella vici TaxID=1703345 RepID=A0A1V9G3V7_9BACT|nr:sulfatase-like hydrolase/transferase [Niastella vici]OQP65303.1 hypothetical protein A3860_16680 [Niastella vici]